MNKHRRCFLLIVIILGVCIGIFYFKHYCYESAEQSLVEALDSLKDSDKKTAKKYLDIETVSEDFDDEMFYDIVMRDFNYDLETITESRGTAVAILTVSNRDFEAIYGQFVTAAYALVLSEAYLSEDERLDESELKSTIDGMFYTFLSETETQIRETQIEIKLVLKGSRWYLDLTETVRDAMYGGFLSAQADADNMLGDRSKEALAKLEEAYESKIDDTQHVLRNAIYYMVEDVWNGCLRHVISCINAGTDANGEDYDLDAGLETFFALLEQKASYDTYIADLDDVYYGDIKIAWQEMTNLLDNLALELQEEEPQPVDFDYIPETQNLETLLQELVTLIYSES